MMYTVAGRARQADDTFFEESLLCHPETIDSRQ
jgi:hypothetical protein